MAWMNMEVDIEPTTAVEGVSEAPLAKRPRVGRSHTELLANPEKDVEPSNDREKRLRGALLHIGAAGDNESTEAVLRRQSADILAAYRDNPGNTVDIIIDAYVEIGVCEWHVFPNIT
jgi:hypothetical protein